MSSTYQKYVHPFFLNVQDYQLWMCISVPCVGNADADTFVCDFHRKQSWLRWMRTLKHNVADQQDEIMRLLNVRVCLSLSDNHAEREVIVQVRCLSVFMYKFLQL